MNAGYGVIRLLERLIGRHLQPLHKETGHKPTSDEAVEMLGKLMERLKAGDQTFAFAVDAARDVYYHRKIVRPRELKFLRAGLDRFDVKILISYDQFLPFNNGNHNDANCVMLEDLPLFYQNRGIL